MVLEKKWVDVVKVQVTKAIHTHHRQVVQDCPPQIKLKKMTNRSKQVEYKYNINSLTMNFFQGDFGFSSSPTYPRPSLTKFPEPKKTNLQSDQLSRKSNHSAKKDQFDDILNEFASRQQKKKQKRKDNVQPFSSTQLDIPSSNNIGGQLKRTQKWSTPNIQLGFNTSPKFPNQRQRSIEDRSDDGRSFKSGFTSKPQQYNLDHLLTTKLPEPKQEVSFQRSGRGMMRPPLAKKESRDHSRQRQRQAKEPSVLNDDISIKFSRGIPQSATNIDLFPNTKITKPSAAPSAEPKQRIIERQKVITVRQQAKELKEQFDKQLSQIKQSYERQLKEVRSKLEEEIQEGKRNKIKLSQEYESKAEEERRQWKRLSEENEKRTKQMHEWELKRREEGYLLQIEKLKAMARIDESIAQNQNKISSNQQTMETRIKQREIQFERRKNEDLKRQLEERQKNLQFEEQNFSRYRKREEMQLQQQRRTFMQEQNRFKLRQLEDKRSITQQKQDLARQMANSELQIIRKRQSLMIQKQQLRVSRQLFEQQKQQFEQFNKGLLTDYKSKLKEIEAEKQKINELQIELHKKVYTVQVVGRERGHSAAKTNSFNRPVSNQQNMRNRINTTANFGMVEQTKQRFREVQLQARRNAVETEEQIRRGKHRVDVSGYINRINRAISRH